MDLTAWLFLLLYRLFHQGEKFFKQGFRVLGTAAGSVSYTHLELIRSQALDRGVGEIAEMAEILANMFRYNISHPKKLATLSQEMENVKNYS